MPDQSRKSTGKKRRIWAIAAGMVLAAVVLVRYMTRNVVAVRMAEAKPGELISTVSTNGKVEPIHNFAAYSPRQGIVRAVYVHEGQKVAAGTLLLTLDDSQAASDLASALAAERGAQAQLQALQQGGTRQQQISLAANIARTRAARDQAQANLATLKKLEAQGAASASEVAKAQQDLAVQNASLKALLEQQSKSYAPIDLEHAEANLANAKAAYASSLDVLSRENVRAPFTGTVYSVLVRPTDFVQAGDRLLQMADLQKMQIRAYFDEPEIGKLKVGQPVTIVWEAEPGRVWHGHVMRTPTTIVGYGTRNVGEALISVDDANEELLPNTNVTITVTLLDLRDVLLVPREALRLDDSGNYVYQVVDGQLRRTPVKIGSLNLTEVQILSGLAQGDTVALSAPDGTPLHPGLAVRRAE